MQFHVVKEYANINFKNKWHSCTFRTVFINNEQIHLHRVYREITPFTHSKYNFSRTNNDKFLQNIYYCLKVFLNSVRFYTAVISRPSVSAVAAEQILCTLFPPDPFSSHLPIQTNAWMCDAAFQSFFQENKQKYRIRMNKKIINIHI